MRHGRPGAWRKLRRSAWEAATPRGVPGLRKTCLSGSRREPPPFLASRGPMQPGAVEGTEAAMTGAHGWSGVTARSVRSTIRHSTPGPESLPGCRPCTLLPSPARRGASRRQRWAPAVVAPRGCRAARLRLRVDCRRSLLDNPAPASGGKGPILRATLRTEGSACRYQWTGLKRPKTSDDRVPSKEFSSLRCLTKRY